jgi:hypothetical protein
VCSDQQAAELSALVVTWTTDRITSEEVYWQPCILFPEVEFGLLVDSIDCINMAEELLCGETQDIITSSK